MADTVLHLAPHPDDELLGCPASLLELRDRGFRVVNVACSLGREDQHARRRAELELACRRAGLELVIPSHLPSISSSDPGFDVVRAERQLAGDLLAVIARHDADLVISPSLHDRHPGHELVARATRRALEALAAAPRWWMWGLWADLPLPTLICEFDDRRLKQILHALSAHAGEMQRNDYRRLVSGRAQANAVLAAERVFGTGSAALTGPYAEVVTELGRLGLGWRLGRPRRLADWTLRGPLSDLDVTGWLDQPSVTQMYGSFGVR